MEKIESNQKCRFPGIRYLFCCAAFLGCFINFVIKVNINVAIVAMVNKTAVYNTRNETVSNECSDHMESFSNRNFPQTQPREGEFDWSPTTQGHVLGAFYYGYSIMQIPAGRLAEIYSGKWVFGIGTIAAALLSMLSPIAARFDVSALITVRCLQGIFQGVVNPSLNTMIGRWVPDTERNFLYSIIKCGSMLGSVAGMATAGVLCNSNWFGGWPSTFYISGFFGCLWFILWYFIITDTPSAHPCIKKTEVEYIVTNQRIIHDIKVPPFPWCKVLTSVPFWAVAINHVGNDWSYFTFINDLPMFFSTVLHFDIEKNGYMSSLPFLLKSLVALIIGYVCDKLLVKGFATTNSIRKSCGAIAGFVAALLLLGVCLAGCNIKLSVAFLFLSIIFASFNICSYNLSYFDMCPEYAGTLIGLSNSISSLTGFLTPLVVGALTEEKQTLGQWYIVFGITMIILLVSTLVFIFFGTTEKQNWATADPEIATSKPFVNKTTEKETTTP